MKTNPFKGPIMGCNSMDGKCDCKTGFDGRRCDLCANGYFGDQCSGKKKL